MSNKPDKIIVFEDFKSQGQEIKIRKNSKSIKKEKVNLPKKELEKLLLKK